MNTPVPSNETQRLQALKQYEILDSAAEKAFDDIAALAVYICDVPMATITLVDSDRQWFKSRIGIDVSETPRNISFCAHTILGKDPMIVKDALKDPRFAESPLVKENPKIRFYAGFPLMTDDDYNLGSLCAIDRRPRELTTAQETAMSSPSHEVIALLNLRRTSAALADALARVQTLEGLLPICASCKAHSRRERQLESTGAVCHRAHLGQLYAWDLSGLSPEDQTVITRLAWPGPLDSVNELMYRLRKL